MCIYIYSGWWSSPTHMKNRSSSVWIIVPNTWENNKCVKPPTSVCVYIYIEILDIDIIQYTYLPMLLHWKHDGEP